MGKCSVPRLKIGHYYRFDDRGDVHIGQYTGRANGDDGFECVVCGMGHKCRTFNLWNGDRDWETWGFGDSHFPTILEDLGEPSSPIFDDFTGPMAHAMPVRR